MPDEYGNLPDDDKFGTDLHRAAAEASKEVAKWPAWKRQAAMSAFGYACDENGDRILDAEGRAIRLPGYDYGWD